jgi:hypothetical protein
MIGSVGVIPALGLGMESGATSELMRRRAPRSTTSRSFLNTSPIYITGRSPFDNTGTVSVGMLDTTTEPTELTGDYPARHGHVPRNTVHANTDAERVYVADWPLSENAD